MYIETSFMLMMYINFDNILTICTRQKYEQRKTKVSTTSDMFGNKKTI